MSSIRTTNAKSQGLTPVLEKFQVQDGVDAKGQPTYREETRWLVPIIADASTVAWKVPETAAEREWCESHREEQEAIAAVRARRAARLRAADGVLAKIAETEGELAPNPLDDSPPIVGAASSVGVPTQVADPNAF